MQSYVYVVIQFQSWFKSYFPLFWGIVMYGNEFGTKGGTVKSRDNIEPQQIHHDRGQVAQNHTGPG